MKMWIVAIAVLVTACSVTESDSEESMLDNKIKCNEYGMNHPADFSNKWKDKEHITYKFYYSSVLDTCIVEMYIDRFVDDEVGSKVALYDILSNGGDVREIISHISWCVDGAIPGYSDQRCTTAAEFAAERKRILPDYYYQ